MFTDFNWIARWNFLLVSWFSKLLLSVLGVYPLTGSFRKILLLQFWLLGLDSVYRKALYGINFVDHGGHERRECTLPRLVSLSQRKGTIIVMTSSGATWKVKPAGFEPASNARVREVCEGVFGPRGSSSYLSCQILHRPLARPLRSPTLIASTCHGDG